MCEYSTIALKRLTYFYVIIFSAICNAQYYKYEDKECFSDSVHLNRPCTSSNVKTTESTTYSMNPLSITPTWKEEDSHYFRPLDPDLVILAKIVSVNTDHVTAKVLKVFGQSNAYNMGNPYIFPIRNYRIPPENNRSLSIRRPAIKKHPHVDERIEPTVGKVFYFINGPTEFELVESSPEFERVIDIIVTRKTIYPDNPTQTEIVNDLTDWDLRPLALQYLANSKKDAKFFVLEAQLQLAQGNDVIDWYTRNMNEADHLLFYDWISEQKSFLTSAYLKKELLRLVGWIKSEKAFEITMKIIQTLDYDDASEVKEIHDFIRSFKYYEAYIKKELYQNQLIDLCKTYLSNPSRDRSQLLYKDDGIGILLRNLQGEKKEKFQAILDELKIKL